MKTNAIDIPRHRNAPTSVTRSGWIRFGVTRQGLLLVLLGLAIMTAYRHYQLRSHYELRVFSTRAGWGYRVLSNGRPLIDQPTVPGRAGAVGFAERDQARRVGERVIEKLQRGQTLPTLSADELRRLAIP